MESNQNSLERYQRTQMRKENIIEKLRERGCRITKQRQILLDVILKEECSCCKEIYYKAARRDSKIGMATVYRMMNMLEEIGAVSRRGTYKVSGLPALPSSEMPTARLDSAAKNMTVSRSAGTLQRKPPCTCF